MKNVVNWYLGINHLTFKSKIKVVNILPLVLLLFMLGHLDLTGQSDTLKVGDVITAPRIKSLNDWRSCHIQTEEDRLINDSLKVYNAFYNSLVYRYSSESKCAFLRMWNHELQRGNYIY